MKPQELIIHCFAEQKEGVWQAFCLNFDLAAQGDTPEEVHDKIVAMVHDYVIDVLDEDGADRDYAAQLLTRRSPISLWLRYYWIRTQCQFNTFKKDLCESRIFDTVMPMQPIRRA